jgi:hypothetical protein
MPDPNTDTTPKFARFYTEYGPSRFKKRNGEPVKLRSLQNAVRKFGIKLIRGCGEPMVDVAATDAQIASFGAYGDERRGRGRPRAS